MNPLHCNEVMMTLLSWHHQTTSTEGHPLTCLRLRAAGILWGEVTTGQEGEGDIDREYDAAENQHHSWRAPPPDGCNTMIGPMLILDLEMTTMNYQNHRHNLSRQLRANRGGVPGG